MIFIIVEIKLNSIDNGKKYLAKAIWLKYPSLKTFHDYFEKQWINSKFKNWAVFHSPPGYTITNNPVESYNKSIKSNFTNRLKLNLIPAFEIFDELIHHESSNAFNYKTTVVVTKTHENNAKKLLLSKFVKKEQHLYNYNHSSGIESLLDLQKKTCSCRYFADRRLCLHLIRTAILEKVELVGMQIIYLHANQFNLLFIQLVIYLK